MADLQLFPDAAPSKMQTFFDGVVNGVELWIVGSDDGEHVDAGAWCPTCTVAVCESTFDQDAATRAAEQHDCGQQSATPAA